MLSSLDCSLHGTCLAEDLFSEAPLNDFAAVEDDKNKKAFSRPLSKLVVPEHSDVETHIFLSDTSITNPSSSHCSLESAGLAEATLSEVPLNDSAAAGEVIHVIPEHSDVKTVVSLLGTSTTTPASFDCSLAGAGLAEDSVNAVLQADFPDEAPKQKKAMAMCFSLLAVPEQSDVEKQVLLLGTSITNPSSLDCSPHGAGLAEDYLSVAPLVDPAAVGPSRRSMRAFPELLLTHKICYLTRLLHHFIALVTTFPLQRPCPARFRLLSLPEHH